MKLGLLLVLFFGALFAPSALCSEEPDPFDQRWMEANQDMAEAMAKKAAAHERWKETGDLDAYAAAVAEFNEAIQRLEPSKLDLWEARQRLIELIYDSDDATVFELYLVAKNRKRASVKAQKEIGDLRARMDRTAQNQAASGVDLVPQN